MRHLHPDDLNVGLEPTCLLSSGSDDDSNESAAEENVTDEGATDDPPSAEIDAPPSPRLTFVMLRSARDEMMKQLATVPPEDGFFLLGPKGADNLVTHCLYDPTAEKTPASFKPSAERFNQWLQRVNGVFREIDAAGFDFKGIVHSHPAGINFPSYGDLEFARATFGRSKNAGAELFFMPIVCRGRLYPYAVTRPDLAVRVVSLKLI